MDPVPIYLPHPKSSDFTSPPSTRVSSSVPSAPSPSPTLNCHLQLSFFSAGMQFKVRDADGCDDVSLPPGVTGTVGEDDFIVALTSP